MCPIIADGLHPYYRKYYGELYSAGCDFVAEWMERKPVVLQIGRIDTADNINLCQRLRGLHEHAYSWSAGDTVSSTFIESFVDEIERDPTLSQRKVIRSFVNVLDVCQQHPDCDPGQELSLANKEEPVHEVKLSESEIYDYEKGYFFALAGWARKNDMLTGWDRKYAYDMGVWRSRNWLITEKQERVALRIIRIAEKTGFFYVSSSNPPTVVSDDSRRMLNEIDEVLLTLKPREREVMQLRFGLGDVTVHTLEQVGRQFNVTRERIRQIQKKTLRKLRDPARSRKLKDMLGLDLGHEGYQNLLRSIFGE